MRIRDPEWKKFRSGINIPDPKHCFSWSTLIDLLQLLGRNDRATWFPAAEFGLLQQRPFIQRAARQGFIKLLIFSHFSNVVDPSTGQIRIRTMGRSGFPPPSATVYRTIREDEFDYRVFCREWLQLGG
jgi:hypothetical protein